MPKFLTTEWMDAARDAVSGSEQAVNASKGVQLILQQVVEDVPDSGTVSYWTQLNDGEVTGGEGAHESPDVTITQNYDTAVALTKGELNAQAAFMAGKIKVSGNMGKLLQHQSAIQSLAGAISSIDTEY